MVEAELSKIIIDEEKSEQLIILKEKNGNRSLPVIIGLVEATAIRAKLSGYVPPRPLTHDLMCNIITELGVSLEKVVIDKLLDNTFHAKLYLRKDGIIKIVDARPSDSIALAVRTKSPIFIEEEVFEKLSKDEFNF
ncbi:MAG: bifunctional nuclease family protein [Candidatus Omnitrophica bacterium]|nr:bifunctional nuclease family protein [Candidatus Omnitrophota bacterium]